VSLLLDQDIAPHGDATTIVSHANHKASYKMYATHVCQQSDIQKQLKQHPRSLRKNKDSIYYLHPPNLPKE
jgi:hypothetical protein